MVLDNAVDNEMVMVFIHMDRAVLVTKVCSLLVVNRDVGHGSLLCLPSPLA